MYEYGGTKRAKRLAEKVAALCTSEAYPRSTGEVEPIETHMAWVFLTARHAYKLKKPVRTAYFDRTTREARRRACETELRLNRRLAPGVYRDVAPLVETGDGYRVEVEGPVVDWLVKMRRLPRERMLDVLIERDALEPDDVERLGDRLARFYQNADPVGLKPDEYRRRIADDIAAKRESLRQPHYGIQRSRVDAAARELEQWLEAHGELLASRHDTVVDAHGDLRPEHICLRETPVIIDCLEFDRNLRLLDPVSELSFLSLECRRLGEPELGEKLLARYSTHTGDEPSRTLWMFYRGYHALVRAAVAIWHLDDHTIDTTRKWQDRARSYLDLIPG